MRKLIRSLAAAGVVAGWENKSQERFPRRPAQEQRQGQPYWDRLLIGPWGLVQQQLPDNGWSQQLLEQLMARLLEFRRVAEPFDDLTIMVARAVEST